MKHFIHSKNRSAGREQGSALITAMIFCFVVVTLMGSYLYLSSSEYRISTRSFLLGASFNLAEGGIDRALYTLNQNDKANWRGGTDGDGRTFWARRLGPYDLGGNIEGYINVVILDPLSLTPEIFSQGEAIGHVAGAVVKQVRVSLSSGFFPFKNGFNSKNGVVLKGNNVKFDSYDSRDGAYGLPNVGSEITVSTISVASDSVDIGNAEIYGYVATGGAQPDVGPNGSITTYDNPDVVDPARITTDYYAEFPDVEEPALTSPSNSIIGSGIILGGDYDLSSWTMGGTQTLTISGDTRIVVSGDINIAGSASVIISSGATLSIYVAGDTIIGGNGIINTSDDPSQLLIFGTNETLGDQTMSIAGGSSLVASVYAPNAVVSLDGGGGGGHVLGAVAAYDASLVGNAHFSYDEALEDYNIGGSGYEVDEWAELSGVSLTAMRLNLVDYGF